MQELEPLGITCSLYYSTQLLCLLIQVPPNVHLWKLKHLCHPLNSDQVSSSCTTLGVVGVWGMNWQIKHPLSL